MEHGFTGYGFAAAAVPHDGDCSDIVREVVFHLSLSILWSTVILVFGFLPEMISRLPQHIKGVVASARGKLSGIWQGFIYTRAGVELCLGKELL